MHFSWEKHLELSRNVAITSDRNQGMALGLMGLALTLLAKDLLMYEELSARGRLLWRELSCWLKSEQAWVSEEINLVLVGFIFLGLNPQC